MSSGCSKHFCFKHLYYKIVERLNKNLINYNIIMILFDNKTFSHQTKSTNGKEIRSNNMQNTVYRLLAFISTTNRRKTWISYRNKSVIFIKKVWRKESKFVFSTKQWRKSNLSKEDLDSFTSTPIQLRSFDWFLRER